MSSPPLHILLVEDDEVDVMNVKRAFEKSLLKPVTFTNFCDMIVTFNKYWTLVQMP